jgi:hypothetical protein
MGKKVQNECFRIKRNHQAVWVQCDLHRTACKTVIHKESWAFSQEAFCCYRNIRSQRGQNFIQDLNFHPYKMMVVQVLGDRDMANRRTVAERLNGILSDDDRWTLPIIWLWLPVSRCGKTCGPTKQSSAIHDQTLILNNWKICHDSILSAITRKKILNVSVHILIWTIFLVLVRGTRAQSLSEPFSYTPHIIHISGHRTISIKL